MKQTLVLISLLTMTTIIDSTADDAIPKRADFGRYLAMVENSPFAVATAPTQGPAAPPWSKEVYLANAAHTPEADLLTVMSVADKNMKEYLSTESTSRSGYSISSIEWSDQRGQTKATICKDSQCATIGFNEALSSQPPTPNAQPPVRSIMPQVPPTGAMPAPHVRGVIQRMPQSNIPIEKLPPEKQKEIMSQRESNPTMAVPDVAAPFPANGADQPQK